MSKSVPLWVSILVTVVLAFSGRDMLKAARNGKLDDVNAALAAGIDPNWQDGDGDTALIVASLGNHPSIVKVLIAVGADLDLHNNWDNNPLKWSVHNKDMEVLTLLIDAGADVNVQDKTGGQIGQTPLMTATRWGSKDKVKALIAGLADVNLATESGNTALFWAVANHHLDIVQILIQAGADIDRQNNVGETPLIQATYKGQLDIVMALIAAQANLILSDQYGDTALHMAAKWNEPDIAKILLKAGSDPSQQNNFKQTPGEQAREYGFNMLGYIIDGINITTTASIDDVSSAQTLWPTTSLFSLLVSLIFGVIVFV